MCGRYCLYAEENDELRELLNRTEGDFKTGEIFPTDKAPIILEKSGVLKPEAVVWGFPGFRGKGVIINARAETLSQRPMFRKSLIEMRCVIPSSGFFEWSHSGPKTKYQFNLPGVGVLYMAGLYQQYNGELRFVIITTAANQSMIDVHNRMPVLLDREEMDGWLKEPAETAQILHKIPPALFRMPA